ncbi:MAG: cysteine desulfurase NifS [Oscillospiraceae bacterium]
MLIYADNAATTKVSDEVYEAMFPFIKEYYGNASSIYEFGRISRRAIEEARQKVAKGINALPREIYFTGCGTEADNWALKSVMKNSKGKDHIITSVIEHHAILHTCKTLEKEGFKVTYIPVDNQGYVNPQDIKNAITDKTAMVSIMYANNEIGTIQPIAEIGAICKENGVIFHTDAVQAVGNVDIDVVAQNIDMLSLSGHKIHAPKGVGTLYSRIPLQNFIDGGAQERNRRGGTENISGIVGFGKAMEIATSNVKQKQETVLAMRDRLIDGILSSIPKCRLNGGRQNRLCGNVNISFEAIEGESLLLKLDMLSICASSGSACTSGSLDPSHVLLAIGLPHGIAHGSLRLSLNEYNTQEEVDYILEKLPEVVKQLRAMSPLWE